MKKYTIIIYNLGNVNNLKKSIDSIVSNRYDLKELIILDELNDLNDDIDFLSYIKKFKYIKLVSSKDCIGIFNMINKGISVSSGEYFLIGTSDIVYNDMILVNMISIFEEGHHIIEFNTSIRYKYNFIKLAFSKKIFNDIGFFDTFNLYSDWDLLFRIKKIFCVKKIDINYFHLLSNENLSVIDNSITFKDYYSRQKNRLYVPSKNYIKYDTIVFDKNIYSNCDIIVSNETEGKLDKVIAKQYLNICKKGKYFFKNLDDKKNIIMCDSNNRIQSIFENRFIFEKGYYTLSYEIDNDVELVFPIVITFFNQKI